MYRANTYSVVARDAETGDLGVAVQSHWFNVGRIVPWAQAGVGAVATQSLVDVSYGPKGLQSMMDGRSAPETLASLLADDPQRAVRQVAMIDSTGRASVHTGENCVAVASHALGEGWAVQANIMRTADVVPAMADAMNATDGSLEDRMLAALTAAEASGGDLRGSQSAALIVVQDGLNEPRTDLRVEDHRDPIRELTRLVDVATAYRHMNEGDDALAAGDAIAAQQEYAAAASHSTNPEILFWRGLGLAQCGDRAGSLISLRAAIEASPDLAELLRRLPPAGLAEPALVQDLSFSLGID